MKRKQIFLFCLVGAIFVGIFGALSHFFYEWSGENKIVGIFFPVNESTWEHLKLAVFPTIVYFAAGVFFVKNENYFVSFFVALFTPMLLIPAIFYFYTAIVGEPILAVDIATYFVSVAAAFVLCGLVLSRPPLAKAYRVAAVIGIALIVVCYMTFTVFPPKNFLFRDSVTGLYGFGQKG